MDDLSPPKDRVDYQRDNKSSNDANDDRGTKPQRSCNCKYDGVETNMSKAFAWFYNAIAICLVVVFAMPMICVIACVCGTEIASLPVEICFELARTSIWYMAGSSGLIGIIKIPVALRKLRIQGNVQKPLLQP